MQGVTRQLEGPPLFLFTVYCIAPNPQPPKPPPLPSPPPPCPNPSYSAWLVCSVTTNACSTVYMNTCQNATTIWTSDPRDANSTYTVAPGRRLQQAPSATFFLGALMATFSTLDGSFAVASDSVQIDLSWSTWPAAAQATCVAAYSLATCADIAANLGGYGNGLVDLHATFGVMSLPYARTVAGGALAYSNNTFVGLSGGLDTAVMPPLPGRPLDASQFPVLSTVGFVARVWYFVDGAYKQNMFTWIHVNVPLPCAGGGTGCGALSFDVVNDNVFLIPLGTFGNNATRSGAWTNAGCINGTSSGTGFFLPTGLGYATSYADCVNTGNLAGMVYLSMSVCGSMDYTCRSCWGCTQAQVLSGQCVVAAPTLRNSTACDAMGAVGASSLYKFIATPASPPPPAAPPPAPYPPTPAPYYARPITGTNTAWYPAGAFWMDPALGTLDGSAPDIRATAWTNLNCGWKFACTSASSGCMPCTGPYISSSSESSALANVGACQSMAARYGFDTVWVTGYRYRPACGVYSLDCWACRGCAFYAGGAVAPAATCVTAGTNRSGCSQLGCNYCYDDDGQPQRTMQIYRTLPAGAAFAPTG